MDERVMGGVLRSAARPTVGLCLPTHTYIRVFFFLQNTLCIKPPIREQALGSDTRKSLDLPSHLIENFAKRMNELRGPQVPEYVLYTESDN